MSHGDKNYPGNSPIKEEEFAVLASKPATAPIINASKQLLRQRGFNVNDTLIVLDSKSKPCLDKNGIPKKFVVVYKDEADILYCRKITADGRLGKGIELPASYDYESFQFVQDPDAAEHVILGDEEGYDPFKENKRIKRIKDKINRFNNKIRIRFNDENEVTVWANTLSVGHVIWKVDYNKIYKYTFVSQTKTGVTLNIVGSNKDEVVNWHQFASKWYDWFSSEPKVFTKGGGSHGDT